MTLQKTAELISGGLTVTTIVLCFMVVWHWRRTAWRIIWDFVTRKNRNLSAEAWFVIGVTIGFAGEFLDNSYWFAPWTFKFLGDPIHVQLMEFGIYPNIGFRQIMGSIAAFCHIKSAFLYHDREGVNRVLFWAIASGLAYVLAMMVMAPPVE